MALYYFKCLKCNSLIKKLLSLQDSKKEYNCMTCNEILVRSYQDTSTIVKETIDNGIQQKAVEQFADSNELYQEREQKSKLDKLKNDL